MNTSKSMNNEFTVSSRFSKEIDYNSPFELIIRSSNGVEIKTKAYLSSMSCYDSPWGTTLFDYTFQVDDRIDEQE